MTRALQATASLFLWAMVAMPDSSFGQGTPPPSPGNLPLPSGVTLQTATLGEIGKAIRWAIAAHPEQSASIATESIAELVRNGRTCPQMLSASIPSAKIQRLLVKPGQQVTVGQNLAMISSGGKQTQLWSTAEGTLVALNITGGDTLEGGKPFGIIRLSQAGVDSAVRMVVVSAVAAAPSHVIPLVTSASYAVPSAATMIATAAKEACPALTAEITKAAAAALPPSSSPPTTASSQPSAPAAPPPVASASASPLATNQATGIELPEAGLTPAQKEMKQEFDQLKQNGGISNPKLVGEAVKRVLDRHTVTTEIPAPLGAKVVAIHKKKGEIVHTGDKLLTLRLSDGREVPILAKQDGIMQAVNVSKGGVIGNTRPSSARNDRSEPNGSILLTLRTI